MTRIQVLFGHPRRTLGVLAAVLVAVGIAVGSGATFTAQSTNPGNSFTTGTLTMSNSKDNAAILTATNMKPGDTATGTVDIQNSGSLAGTYSLSRSALTDSDTNNPLSQKLDLVIKDCGDFSSGTPTCDVGDTVLYGSPTATLFAMTSSVSLGTFAVSEKHRYEFTVNFQSGATNTYQGATSTATFQWDATQ